MKEIKVLGIDPSLSNFGFAKGVFHVMGDDVDKDLLSITDIFLQETAPTKTKNLRKNSDDLERARLLHKEMVRQMQDADIIVAEVPVGSQSARAMASYGVCIGILASIKKPLIQVNPNEVKLALTGSKTASKQEMIDRAYDLYPNLPWLAYKKNGLVKLTAKNEHMADAVGTLHAAKNTDDYMMLTAL